MAQDLEQLEREDPRVERGKELGRWLGYTIVFEAIGFGLALVIGNLVHAIWMRASQVTLDDDMPLAMTLGLSLLVGAVEGASLGTGQWLVLRRRLDALAWRAWALATAVGGGLAWALGMGLGGRFEAIPVGLIAPLMIGSGVIFGGLLGVSQWLVLRAHVGRAWRWIPANAIGWTVGLLAAYAAAAVIDEATPLPAMIGIGLLAGATMAIVPALTTGITLRGMSAVHPVAGPEQT